MAISVEEQYRFGKEDQNSKQQGEFRYLRDNFPALDVFQPNKVNAINFAHHFRMSQSDQDM